MNYQFILKEIQKEEQLGSVIIKSLKEVSLQIEQGQFYSIVGPEGSGKSKLLNILGFIEQASSGHFYYKNNDVKDLKQKEVNYIRANKIGFIPQAPNLNLTLSVLENVSMVSKILGEDNWVARDKAAYWLEKVGLAHKINRPPLELDFTDFKKIGIAKAMIKKPEALLVDDIYYKVAQPKCRELFDLLVKINGEFKTTVVQTARNADHTKAYGPVYLINDGVVSQSLKSSTAA